jgi:pimeloyl-ACP methyl ester carboxylesterase
MKLRVPIDIGEGPSVLLLHGFAMTPGTYRNTAELLARVGRVVVPDLFAFKGPWRYDRVLQALGETVDSLGLEQMTIIGHSFGGGLELGFAAAHPEKVSELVFSDTLAVSEEWGLADEALRHPLRLLELATPAAVSAFTRSCLLHPRQVAEAGWWGFTSGRGDDIGEIAWDRIPAHVVWANRDSVLTRSDGQQFAKLLGATFTVADSPDGHPIDHDWMFQEPRLFVSHLQRLGLRILRGLEPLKPPGERQP